MRSLLYITIALVVLLPLAWVIRRLLIAAIVCRCPKCGSKFYSVAVCGDRRYERWHCRACNLDWEERYSEWDPRGYRDEPAGTNGQH